jgi:protein O-GlcNAc transferase
MTVQESMTRARTAFRIGDYAQAEALVLGVLDKKKRQPEVHNFLGTVYGRMGDHARAVRQFKQAIDLRPQYAEAYNNLGVTLKNMQRAAGAEAAFRKALSLAPARADIHYNLGNVFKAAGPLLRAHLQQPGHQLRAAGPAA